MQIASAYKRMAATYVEGNDQGEGSGGPAQTRDLLRFLYSIDVALSRTDNLKKRHPSVEDITTIESEEPPTSLDPVLSLLPFLQPSIHSPRLSCMPGMSVAMPRALSGHILLLCISCPRLARSFIV